MSGVECQVFLVRCITDYRGGATPLKTIIFECFAGWARCGLHPWCIVIGGGIWHRFSPPFLTYRALADENVAVISFHWTDGFVKVGSIKDDTHKSGHLHTFTQIHCHPNTNETCATLSTPRSKRHH